MSHQGVRMLLVQFNSCVLWYSKFYFLKIKTLCLLRSMILNLFLHTLCRDIFRPYFVKEEVQFEGIMLNSDSARTFAYSNIYNLWEVPLNFLELFCLNGRVGRQSFCQFRSKVTGAFSAFSWCSKVNWQASIFLINWLCNVIWNIIEAKHPYHVF